MNNSSSSKCASLNQSSQPLPFRSRPLLHQWRPPTLPLVPLAQAPSPPSPLPPRLQSFWSPPPSTDLEARQRQSREAPNTDRRRRWNLGGSNAERQQ
ncbi:hypothetical protein CDL15_Pgr021288 [Punica granatum]|uniref:Uncharacterized protein n=1 Tax=Punica granatum TaxID=22663 RepID=A0A218WQ00_PUNGR|nr:hypothetical protein CDL15_Pgr021288 [Punica granatum]PKI75136.1 hypothetical protein CRG98_004471 [Punica granatum]